ncbi:MAG: ThiF family adenylyltransferase [Anaeromyxobacter sp.]|nr:ThiF family adenylyltransferase [Anaeromyxobacter sp.]
MRRALGDLPDRTALVFGLGALGGPAAHALAAAGVGRLLLADQAPVESTDLVVAPLLAEGSVGQPRAAAAALALARLFPALEVTVVEQPLVTDAAPMALHGADLVVEASGRFPLMFAVNDAGVALGVPVVHGAVAAFTLQLLTTLPGVTGCLRCLFEGPPPPAEAGVLDADPLGPLAGLAGSLMGIEAARVLGGLPGAYAGQLLAYEARTGWSRTVPVAPRPGCAACGHVIAARASTGEAAP